MSNRNIVTRRGFAAAASLPLLQARQQPAPAAAPAAPAQRRGTTAEQPPFAGALTFSRRPVPRLAEPFPMEQVRLLRGPFLDAAEWNRGYLHRLPADRLLHNFRLNAGLPTSASPLGGWEEPKGELRGHFVGHYLSASGLMFASTGDSTLKARGEEMVDALARCQAKLGGGYLSAFPLEFWDRLAARKPVWAPFYTIHKIMAGLLDMHRLAGSTQALAVVENMAGWADRWTAAHPESHMQEILNTEYGGMNDILYKLAATTGNDHWAVVGDRFTKKRFFNPLALYRDELRGLHVNTHIPQVTGAAARYDLSGDMRFHDVAWFFWNAVANGRSYVTKGTSNNEGWLVPPRRLAAELPRSVSTAECCCSYNMLKLTRHLYSWTAEPGYFDYYERALLNHRLGAIQPRTGYTQYYLSHTPGAWRTFNNEDQCFWCCTGSGVEEFSKLNDSIYWRDSAGLYVNLFIASELHWPERGLRLRQETSFPAAPSTSFGFSLATPAHFTVRLRVPAWLGGEPLVRLNGRQLESSASPGSYLSLTRTWQSGDRIEMELPMHLCAESMPDDPGLQAILYGPLVLAGDLGSDGLTPDLITGQMRPLMRPRKPGEAPPVPPVDVPSFRALGTSLNAWIKPGNTPLTFRTSGQPRNVDLVAFNSLFDRRYSIYWRVNR